MPKIIATILILLLCASRTVSYAVYTAKNKNTYGVIGVIALLISATLASVMLLVK